MTTSLYEAQVAAGPNALDTEALVGIVVDDTYVFAAEHAVVDDIDDFEVSGAGYTRLTADARVELADGVWTVWMDAVTTTDLSAVAARAGIVWARPNNDLVAFTADPGGAVNPYEPTYPSGLFDYPVQSIDVVLADLRTDVDAALAGGLDGLTAAAPVTLTLGEIGLDIGAGLTLDGGNLTVVPSAAWGDFTAGSIASLLTRTDGALVKILYNGAAIPVVEDPVGPVLLGTVATAHRPSVPVQAGAWWAGGGDFGSLKVVVDDDTGSLLGTAGGVWVQDGTGTLSDTDDVYPLLASVDWWIA